LFLTALDRSPSPRFSADFFSPVVRRLYSLSLSLRRVCFHNRDLCTVFFLLLPPACVGSVNFLSGIPISLPKVADIMSECLLSSGIVDLLPAFSSFFFFPSNESWEHCSSDPVLEQAFHSFLRPSSPLGRGTLCSLILQIFTIVIFASCSTFPSAC